MKLTEKDFEVFKEHFNGYVEKFGLTGYQIYFDFSVLKESSESSFASITSDSLSMIANVEYNKFIPQEAIKNINIKKTAKHEAIHLLLGKLDNLARARYVTPPEIRTEVEELVNKLTDLIGD